MLKVRLVVLNYNRKDLLERFLPSVVNASKESRHDCSVTVLDNASTDDSAEFVQKNYPDVILARAKENKVLCSYNDYIATVDDDVVVLLNNDIDLYPGWVDPMMENFLKEKDVFFVASKGNRARARFRMGVLSADISYPDNKKHKEERGYTLSAGSAAFDRRKFIALGGFDSMYLPGYYEDVDLCWRGWKRGWYGYYEPSSDQFHEPKDSSFRKAFGEKAVHAMTFRNGILFMVKNITDPYLTVRFLMCLPLRVLSTVLKGKMYLLSGLREAFVRLPVALKARKESARLAVLTDREVLKRVNGFYGA